MKYAYVSLPTITYSRHHPCRESKFKICLLWQRNMIETSKINGKQTCISKWAPSGESFEWSALWLKLRGQTKRPNDRPTTNQQTDMRVHKEVMPPVSHQLTSKCISIAKPSVLAVGKRKDGERKDLHLNHQTHLTTTRHLSTPS